VIEHEHIAVEREGHVTTVIIDRPEAKNACTGEMWVTLGEMFRYISYSGARVAVLTGRGQDFCAGADLSGGGLGDGTAAGSMDASHLAAMRLLGEAMTAIYHCQIPVIAKVDGVCIGAGFGLALAADMLWCSDRARFSAIFAKRGLSLDFGTSWLLRQRVGVHKAKEIALTAKMMSGTEAHELGFVNAAVPAGELDAAVADVVATIAGGPPVALSMTKRELDNASTSSLAQALETEALAQSVNVHTDDMREAFLAYVERRPPEFKGR
jgi:enoyl-CoA hydratase/carnithine racemase